jgi:SAM-dependent methyltransferase
MSWDEAYANHYEAWSAHMTADIPFYVALAREAAGPLVELAIGNGRVAIPVGQATGRPVIGIDTSPAMLALARARAAEAGVELDLREGDMRDLALAEPAALIYCPFRALLHLPTSPHVRARRRRAAAGWTLRLERVCLRPPDRRARRPRAPGRAGAPHDSVRRGRQSHRHHPRRRRDELALVGHEE